MYDLISFLRLDFINFYPSMMQGIGISFGELVTRLIELGVAG